jgi:DNA-binding transcriptional regulator YhcF (GntR family)
MIPVSLWIGGRLYQFGACAGCAVLLHEEMSPFTAHQAASGPHFPVQVPPGGRAVSPTPQYDLILSVLRARIADGTYPAGTYLPTRRDLAAEHSMSVSPVSNACWQLEQEGLLRSASHGRYIIRQAAPPKSSGSGHEAAGHPVLRPAAGPAPAASLAGQHAACGGAHAMKFLVPPERTGHA